MAGGPATFFIPFAIALIAHAAIFAVWIARQKVNDDAIRSLWQELADIWGRNPEVYDLVMSGNPIDTERLAAASAQTRADVSAVLQLSDALGGLAGRFGSDRSTLFSLWPAGPMWDSLAPVATQVRERNPIAYVNFERAVALYNRFANRRAAEVRGESNVVLVTVAVGIAVLIYALDQTIVATALPRITQELQGINLYGWVFSAYTIAATATTLLFGRLGDLTNRRRLFVIAMSGFLVGSILCGLAPNMPLLVAFRAMQGLFGGATFPLAIGIIADTYPIERRAQGFAIIPTTYAISSVMGPLVGGFVTANIGWRAIFFINIPVVTTAIFLLTVSYRARAAHGRLRWQDLDPPGVVTLFGGLVTILIALTTGNQDWDWWSWEEVVMLVGGAAMLLAFGYIELHVERPLLPLRILRHRGLGGALLTIAMLAWVSNSMIVFMPEYVQAGLSADTQTAGIVLIPLLFTWAATANIAVRLGQRLGFRNVAWYGVPPIIAGLIYLYFIHFGYQAWTVAPGLALIGLGAGLINPNMLVMAQSSLSDRDQSMAGGLGNVAQSLSAAIAAASLTALQINRLDSYAHLSSVDGSSDLITPLGRHIWAGFFGEGWLWVEQAQRWMTVSIHDVFTVAFVPAVILAFWLWRVVVPTNAQMREIRLPPLRAAPEPAPASPPPAQS